MNKRRQRLRKNRLFFLAGLFFLWTNSAWAQQTAGSDLPAIPKPAQQGIFLVFPFESAGASQRLDWVGEGLEELTIQRLSAAGQQVYTHAGRLNEMDEYGLPASAKLSRATMLHIAQELDADYVVFGSFTSDGNNLTVDARLLRITPVALLPAVRETGPLSAFMEIHNRLVWNLLRSADSNFSLGLEDFSRLQRPLTFDAFEQYIHGLLAGDDDSRLRALKEAARLQPDWPDPAFAVGELYFQHNDCNSAVPWLSKIPSTHAQSVEALFAIGVCRLRQGQPDKAEEVFANLQEDLHHSLISGADLPEILNNLGIARARQENLPAALMVIGRANDIDPDEDDYPFNLGLLALQQKEYARAAIHFEEAVKREPENPQNRAFLVYALEKEGRKAEATAAREDALAVLGGEELPEVQLDLRKPDALVKFERVMPQLDTTSLRLELEGPQALLADGGSPAHRDAAVTHLRRGRQELRAGRLDVAESDFRDALTADPHNASAHRELGQVYRSRGKLDDAIREFQLSLSERDSAEVHNMLAHIYLAQNKPELARAEAEKAVKLAPNYADAKELLERLGRSKPTGGGT